MHDLAAISRQIWDMKYRLKAPDGRPLDEDVPDTWRRVAKALAAPEADPAAWEGRFFDALSGFRFLPAGRILAGAGTARSVTLFNCFVMGRIEDDLGRIFDHLREAALTMQQGGGIGYDFSPIRPKGAPVRGVGADASGPVSFMDVWDSMCRTIQSAGARRGAMMATLRCDHPDVELFVDAKRDPARLRMFNLSVLVTDAFMEAVKQDAPWPLVHGGAVHRTVRARDLWERIMRATYDYAEPGVIFIDRVNQMNNLWYCEDISSTNPCLARGTPVMTERGSMPVETLLGRVTRVHTGTRWQETEFRVTGRDQRVMRLGLQDGSQLRVTPAHAMILADGSRRPAAELVVGHRLRGVDGDLAVEWVAPDDGIEPEVYCCTVEGEHSFALGNGLVVGNCGEQPLPPYGACLLGSINLAALVREPFAEGARLDLDALRELVPVAVRMMDNVVEVSRFPLAEQRAEAQAKRRIGLGVTGLADALALCRARYGTERAVALAETWLSEIRRAAYRASIELAREKGPFPLFDAERYLEGANVRNMEPEIREGIRRHGIRNALLTSIAPTGTISLLADNVSSGIEPVFAYRHARKVLLPDGTPREEVVLDHAYRLFRATFGEEAPLPDYFVDAQTLAPSAHLVMQAVAQRHVDSSISKTINCPEDLPFDAFMDVYAQAYELGCKGCTTYRPNAVTGAVLSVREEPRPEGAKGAPPPSPPAAPARPERAPGDDSSVVYMTRPLDRPDALPGQTYKLRWPESDHALYITLNDVVEGGRRRPFEVFINSKNMEHYAWTVALTRMVSAVFRRGGDVSFVVDELKAVFDPRGGQWVGGRYVPSLLAAIGEVIERHMRSTGFLPGRGDEAAPPGEAGAEAKGEAGDEPGRRAEPLRRAAGEGGRASADGGSPSGRLAQCPRCAQAALVRQEGCDLCLNCGHSKCS